MESSPRWTRGASVPRLSFRLAVHRALIHLAKAKLLVQSQRGLVVLHYLHFDERNVLALKLAKCVGQHKRGKSLTTDGRVHLELEQPSCVDSPARGQRLNHPKSRPGRKEVAVAARQFIANPLELSQRARFPPVA